MSVDKHSVCYLMGRCANGAERDVGTKLHAVAGSQALCGATYGRQSAGWSEHQANAAVTCSRCPLCLRAQGEGEEAAQQELPVAPPVVCDVPGCAEQVVYVGRAGGEPQRSRCKTHRNEAPPASPWYLGDRVQVRGSGRRGTVIGRRGDTVSILRPPLKKGRGARPEVIFAVQEDLVLDAEQDRPAAIKEALAAGRLVAEYRAGLVAALGQGGQT